MSEQEQSSEVKDQEKSEAEQALDATAGPASEAEPSVPLHKHTALRDRAQAAEKAQAFAEGQLAAIKETAQAPPVVSPLDAEIARQAADGIDEENMSIPPRVMKAQEAHNRQVAEQATATEAKNVLHAKQNASAGVARTVHEDWQTVVSSAFALMTPGEILDIEREGDNFGEISYAKAQEVLAKNTESKTETAPEKPSESEAEEEKEVPTQGKILADLNVDPDTTRVAQL